MVGTFPLIFPHIVCGSSTKRMQASATSSASRRAGGIDWEKRVDDVKVSKTYDPTPLPI